MAIMKLTEKAERFADRHCGRYVPGNGIDRENWEWYYRLYLRFVQYELERMPSLRIYTSSSCPGLIDEHAADFECAHPLLHCERGAVCLSGRRVRELYTEAVTENI